MNEVVMQQIISLQDRKRQIKNGTYMQEHALHSAYLRWLHDAMDLLLELELKRNERDFSLQKK